MRIRIHNTGYLKGDGAKAKEPVPTAANTFILVPYIWGFC
jgi:hypothetical protein